MTSKTLFRQWAIICVLFAVCNSGSNQASAETADERDLPHWLFNKSSNARLKDGVGSVHDIDTDFVRFQAHAEALGDKPTSSSQMGGGRCTPRDCTTTWSEHSTGPGSVDSWVIDPLVAVRNIQNDEDDLALTVRWKAPAPLRSLTPHDVSRYEVLLDFGGRYQIYHVTEKISGQERADRRVRQWLHVDNVGPHAPEVHIRPVFDSRSGKQPQLAGQSRRAERSNTDHGRSGELLVGHIDFDDPNLEQCVLDQSRLEQRTEVSEIETLICADEDIHDLSGIEELTALRVLFLNHNPILDINELQYLLELESLNLSNTDVLDFDVIHPGNFPTLSTLYLNHTYLSDLSAISRFENLEELEVAGAEIQSIPVLATQSLQKLDISFNPLSDLSGLSDAVGLEHLVFNDYKTPLLPGPDQGWQISGDLTPLIELAQRADSNLTTVELNNHMWFSCSQLDALGAFLDDDQSGEPGLVRPESCLDLPILNAPAASVSPSIGNLYELSWEAQEGTATVFHLQESWISPKTGEVEYATIETQAQQVDISNLEARTPRKYWYRVRACNENEDPSVCTAWSESIQHIVMDSEGIPGDEALADIPDAGLRSCLYGNLAQLEDGDIDYLMTGELGSLTCIGYGIESLEGIHQFPSLTSVNFADNALEGLEPLGPLFLAAAESGRDWGAVSLGRNQLQESDLHTLVENGANFLHLRLNDNPLIEIDTLSNLQPLFSLRLDRTEIETLDPISDVQIGFLQASHNYIAEVPFLNVRYRIDLDNNEIMDIEGLSGLGDDFWVLDLARNPIGSIPGHADTLGQLVSLFDLKLYETGVSDLSFMDSLLEMESLDISSNPLSSFTGLDNLPNLRHLNASETDIHDLQELRDLPRLARLELLETDVTDLAPLEDVERLSTLQISNGDLSAINALEPLSSLSNLRTLEFQNTGLTSVRPILELIGSADNNFGSTGQSRVDVLQEAGLPCRQVRSLQEEGFLFSLRTNIPDPECQPDVLEASVTYDEVDELYSISWEPSIPPEGYLGTAYYEIAHDDGQGLEVVKTVGNVISDGTSIEPAAVSGLPISGFRVRGCRDDAVCSGWSELSTPIYPLEQPTEVAFDPDLSELSWSYEQSGPSEDMEGLYFVISPLFPVVEPIVVAAQGQAEWSYTIEDPEAWPGRLVRVSACRDQEEGQHCGPSMEIKLAEPVVDPTIPAPSAVHLSVLGSEASQGGYQLSWNDSSHEEVTHYKVRKSTLPGTGLAQTRTDEFSVEANELAIRRFGSGARAEYQVAACVKEEEGGNRCSEFTSAEGEPFAAPPTDYELGSVSDLCWEHAGDSDLSPDGNGDYRGFVRLRWRYDTSNYDTPVRFNGEAVESLGGPGYHYDPSRSFNEPEYGGAGQTFWKSGEGNGQYPLLAVETDGDGANTVYSIKAAMPDANDTVPNSEWIEGDAELIEPLMGENGSYQWDTASQCEPQDWPEPGRSGTIGGPGMLNPGHWVTSQDDAPSIGVRTGWRFYWTSDIEFDPAIGTFGLNYDLLAFWYTYQQIDGKWSPVWLYSRMEAEAQDDGTFVIGSLHYPGREDSEVGNLRIFFELPDGEQGGPGFESGNHNYAWVDLVVNDVDGLNASEQFPIRTITEDDDLFEPGDLGQANPTDHYRGIWIEGDQTLFDDQATILHESDFVMSEWADGSMTSMAIKSFDDSGIPIWFIHFDCGQSGDGSGCDPGYTPDIAQSLERQTLYTEYPAVDPFFVPPLDQQDDIENDMQESVATEGTGVVRQLRGAPFASGSGSFDRKYDHTHGSLCVDLSNVSGNTEALGGRVYDIQVGDSFCNAGNVRDQGVEITKIANFHDIEYQLPNASESGGGPGTCDLNNQAGEQCSLELTWFTDDYNPDAQPMYSTGSSSEYRHIDELCAEDTGTDFDFAAVSIECNILDIDVPGTEKFWFHLVNNPRDDGGWDNDTSAVIATSRVLTVIGGSVPPVEEPPEVPEIDTPEPELESSRVGATRGEFNVSHSGAAEYTIPVMTAPGSGDVTPELAFGYSSAAGESSMGPGWQVQGFSTITRCGSTYEQDGSSAGVSLSANDRFCLDGQRLILVSDDDYGAPESEYRLEIDSFERITAKGDVGGFPRFFIVESKDGSQRIFGSPNNTSSAAMEIPGDSNDAMYAWPISRFEDSVGNYIEFDYDQPGRNAPNPWIEWVPSKVRYTGNSEANTEPYAEIEFHYSEFELGEISLGYIAGNSQKRTRRLQRVDSRSDGELLRSYRIGYYSNEVGKKLLESIQECWGSGANDCYEELTFDWWSGAPDIPNTHALPVAFDEFGGAISGDVSGDGRDEVIMIRESAAGTVRFEVLVNEGTEHLTLDQGSVAAANACGGLSSADMNSPSIVDLDGDSVGGVVYIAAGCDDDGQVGIYHQAWDADAQSLESGAEAERIGTLPAVPGDADVQLTPMDLEGDGRIDLLLTSNGVLTDDQRAFGWVYKNGSEPGDIAFDEYQKITIDYDTLPFGEPLDGVSTGDNDCPFITDRDFVRKLDFPIAAVDQSGRTAIAVRIRRLRFCSDQPQITSPAQFQSSESNVEFEEHFVFTIKEPSEGSLLRAENWSAIGEQESDFVYASDLNGDGYTDFIEMADSDSSDDVVVRLHVNDGESLSERSTGVHVDRQLAGLVQILDYTGDGVPDILTPSEVDSDHADWCLHEGYLTNAGEVGFHHVQQCEGLRAGKAQAGSQTLFMDWWGNGIVDPFSVLRRGGSVGCLAGSPGDFCAYTSEGVLKEGGEAQARFVPRDKIRSIADGFGAWTDLEYGSLTQNRVHSADSGGGYDYGRGAAVFDVNMRFYVVTSAVSLSPHHRVTDDESQMVQYVPEGESRLDYYYVGAKLQSGGRGFLGFRQVASYDPASSVLTVTDYRQDFPFVGKPRQTSSVYFAGGVAPWVLAGDTFNGQFEAGDQICGNATVGNNSAMEIGRAVNDWALLDDAHTSCRTTDGAEHRNYCHPYLQSSTDYNCSVANDEESLVDSTLTHSVTTEKNLTDYGEADTLVVTTRAFSGDSEGLVSRQTTSNEYDDNDVDKWHLERLTCSLVGTEIWRNPADNANVDPDDEVLRRSAFRSNPETGLLEKEYVQPDGCDNPEVTARLTRSYAHDDFGNRTEKHVSGSDIDRPRRSKKVYDAHGRWVKRRYSHIEGSYRLTERIEERDRYGNALEIVNGQGVFSYKVFDFGGRSFATYSEDGSWVEERYSTDVSNCPAGAVFAVMESSSSGPEQKVCKDALGRDVRALHRGFSGQWISEDVRYDNSSRVLQSSEPYVDIASEDPATSTYCNETEGDQTCLPSPFWTTQIHDSLGRVVELHLPNGTSESTQYDGFITTVIDTRGRESVTEENAIGETVRETKQGATTTFAYNASGDLWRVRGPQWHEGSGSDQIHIEYDDLGHKETVSDPDMGEWLYKHNALGELKCQIDSRGQGIYKEYDSLGRETERRELRDIPSVTSCNGEELARSTWAFQNQSGAADFGNVIVEEKLTNEYGGVDEAELLISFEYDSYGRQVERRTEIREGSGLGSQTTIYVESTTYDARGRVFQQFDGSGQNRGTRRFYNEHGYVERISEISSGHPETGVPQLAYWTVDAMDARGNVIAARLGNDMEVVADYDPATGELTHRTEFNQMTNHFGQSRAYHWNDIGNLVRRDSAGDSLEREFFHYDDHDRLEKVWRSDSGVGDPYLDPEEWDLAQALSYDVSGNIRCKSDVSDVECGGEETYVYGSGATGSGPGPHAVQSIELENGTRTFEYDENGNVISDQTSNGGAGKQRELNYTPSNLLRKATTTDGGEGQGTFSSFVYGTDGRRVIQHNGTSTVSSRTHYIGNIEVIRDANGSIEEIRRYVAGVALVKIDSAGVGRTAYQHRDHLGSIIALSNEIGEVIARMRFDAWGNRQDPLAPEEHWNPWEVELPDWASPMKAFTDHGFTGHEHLDDHGLIHMNGRIYDPHLGRFLQADPLVEDVMTLNRYTYVHNNPLLYYDPSGYLSIKDVIKIAAVVVIGFVTSGLIAGTGVSWLGIGAGSKLTGAAAYAAAAAGGALSGYIMTGSLEGALWGAFSGMAFYGVGQHFAGSARSGDGFWGSTFANEGELLRASVAHGVTGGTISKLQGGRFGHGFISAGVTKLASPAISSIENDFGQIATASIVGGSVSSATGGKFANGAATAAMSYAFGSMARSGGNGTGSSASSGKGNGGFFSRALNVVGDVAGKIWSLPNTAIGTVFGGLGHVTGEIGQALGVWSREPTIGFGNNALEFTGNPFAGGGAIALGNTITWTDERNGQFYSAFSSHEQLHTLQGQFLGPFYIPAQVTGMGASVLTTPFFPSLQRTVPGASQYFHGKMNFMEGPFLEDKLYD